MLLACKEDYGFLGKEQQRVQKFISEQPNTKRKNQNNKFEIKILDCGCLDFNRFIIILAIKNADGIHVVELFLGLKDEKLKIW